MGDDREIGTGSGVGLAASLFPALEGGERNPVGAGEGLLRQTQLFADRTHVGNLDSMDARDRAFALGICCGLFHRRDQVLAKV